MSTLAGTPHAINWLRQFSSRDRLLASQLLDQIALVPHDSFVERLQTEIHEIGQSIDGTIGLYVEREIKKSKGTPDRLFKESPTKPKRAYGDGPKVIDPKPGQNQDVGSEGIIGQLVTELGRAGRKKYLVNPGPDQIRQHKIRAFVVVTDFIGSGKRTREYLTAAWRIASVKSWISLKLLSFYVVVYAGTEKGIKSVRNHNSRPSVHQVQSCPTITTAFNNKKAKKIAELCKIYDPDNNHDLEALGFNGTGALIAFAHGAPNNLPKILHKKGPHWNPLFPCRTTSNFRSIFGNQSNGVGISARLAKLGERGILESGWLSRNSNDAKARMLLMIELRTPPRDDDALSRQTGLTIPEIREFISQLVEWGWLTKGRRVTNEGRKQIRHAQKPRKEKKSLPQSPPDLYYPESLRMPRDLSS